MGVVLVLVEILYVYKWKKIGKQQKGMIEIDLDFVEHHKCIDGIDACCMQGHFQLPPFMNL